jgi:hypothetical protein
LLALLEVHLILHVGKIMVKVAKTHLFLNSSLYQPSLPTCPKLTIMPDLPVRETIRPQEEMDLTLRSGTRGHSKASKT